MAQPLVNGRAVAPDCWHGSAASPELLIRLGLLFAVPLQLHLLPDDQLDGLQGVQAHPILAGAATLGERLRVVYESFVWEATLVQSEALAVRFELLAVLVRGDEEALSLLIDKLLRAKLVSDLPGRGLQAPELADLAEELDDGLVGLPRLIELIRVPAVSRLLYELNASWWLEECLPFTSPDVGRVTLFYLLIFA